MRIRGLTGHQGDKENIQTHIEEPLSVLDLVTAAHSKTRCCVFTYPDLLELPPIH